MPFDSICCEFLNVRKLINVDEEEITYDSYVESAIKNFGLKSKNFLFRDVANECIIEAEMFIKYRSRFENTLILRIEEYTIGLMLTQFV